MRLTVFTCLALLLFSCKKEPVAENIIQTPNDTDTVVTQQPSIYFDLSADSAPRFVQANYIELSKINRISLFRSGYGHDYSDDFEYCRSMKHYFDPGNNGNDSIRIYSPVKGKIVRIITEWAGIQIHIQSDDYPAFVFVIFHVNALPNVQENISLQAGQLLGYHIGSMTSSDIAVKVMSSINGPKPDSANESGLRLFSFFHVMSDSLFNQYQLRGISTREEMIITESIRNNAPLDCNGEAFLNPGTLPNWVYLQ